MSRLVFWADDLDATSKRVEKALRSFGQKPDYRYHSAHKGFYTAKPGEVVLSFGKEPLLLMAGAGLVPKNRTVSGLRGQSYGKPDTGKYLVTFNVGEIVYDASKEEEIAWDVRLAERLLRTGGLLPEVGTYRWVMDFSELVAAVDCTYEKTGQPVEVAFDTETLGLHPYDGHPIVSLGFTMEEGKADCVYVKDIQTEAQANKLLETVRWLLTSPKVKLCGANLKFDLNWVWVQWGIKCTNFTFDSLIAGSMIDENRSNSLENHAKIYTTMGGYDALFNNKYDKSRMDLVPKEDLLGYMGGDVDAALRVARKIKREMLEQPVLTRLYVNIVHPAARAFENVERRGLLADRDKFEELRQEIEGKNGDGGVLAELNKKAINLLPMRLRAKHTDAHGNLNLNRPEILRDYFFSPMGLGLKPLEVTPGKGLASTAKGHLSRFHNVPEAKEMVATLDEMGVIKKVLSTYVKGFLKHLRRDGRFHPSFMFFSGRMFDDDDDDSGTTTGRLSAKDPAAQTIPKRGKWAKKLRKCYPAPPGYLMFSTDCMQGELKIAACVANEENMLKAYRSNLDLHAVTGAAMMAMDYADFIKLAVENPELFELGRYKAKAANFGLLYGMMAKGFVRYAWQTFKMSLTIEQAQDIIDKFFGLYPGLKDWHEEYINMAKRDQFVVSPFGRVRHLPLIHSKEFMVRTKEERRAINSPIQSSLSELMIWAFLEMERQLPDVQAIVNIHDAGLGYVPEDKALELGKQIVDIASNLPVRETFGWNHQLPFTFDLELGPNMCDMEKIKFDKPPANDNQSMVKVAA